jgi:hypothetical protein
MVWRRCWVTEFHLCEGGAITFWDFVPPVQEAVPLAVIDVRGGKR